MRVSHTALYCYLLLLFASASFVSHAQVCNLPQIPTNLRSGMVAYYPFCGNVDDKSGNNNILVNNGAVLTSDRFGNSNSAYRFTNQMTASTNYLKAVNSQPFALNNYTISLWFNPSSFYPQLGGTCYCYQSLASYAPAFYNAAPSYWLALTAGDNSYLGAQHWTPTTGGQSISSRTVTINAWHHAALSYDGTTMRLYLNGNMVTSANVTITFANQIQFLIGANGDGPSPGGYYGGFNGIIDDIFVYNRALQQCEISQLYSATSSVIPSLDPPLVSVNGPTNICSGSSVTLSTQAVTGATYQWLRNGLPISGATSTTFSATTAGNYSVRRLIGSCATTSSDISITANPCSSSFADITSGSSFSANRHILQVLDFDNDFDDDLIVHTNWPVGTSSLASASGYQLWRNNGNGTFGQVASNGGLTFPTYYTEVYNADLDNNGWTDVFIKAGDTVMLFLNRSGTFVNRTSASALGGGLLSAKFGVSPASILSIRFADVNVDGELDIALLARQGNQTTLMVANGLIGCDSIGVSYAAPVTIFSSPQRFNNRFNFVDIDNDFDMDLLLGELPLLPQSPGDQYFNHTLRVLTNNGSGTFSLRTGTGYEIGRTHAFGSSGEFNNDGFVDLYGGAADCCIPGNPLSVWYSNGNSTFSSSANAMLRKGNPYYTSSQTIDLNLDGWQDILWEGVTAVGGTVGAKVQYFRNTGNRQFLEDASSFNIFKGSTGNCCPIAVSTDATTFDYNNDGKQDLYIESNTTTAATASQQGRWLMQNTVASNVVSVRLQACVGVKDGIGARIRYKTGGVWYHQQVNPTGKPFPNGIDYQVLGLGANTVIDSLQILWVGGAVTNRVSVSANQKLTIFENPLCASAGGVISINPLADTIRVCGTNAILDAGAGFASYTWNTGATTRSIAPTTGGFYKVTVTTASGCAASDSTWLSLINANIHQNDTTVCTSTPVRLSVDSFYTLRYGVGNRTRSGGFVFHDKGSIVNGWRYMEVTPTDQANGGNGIGCYCTSLPGSVDSVGAGLLNTQTLVSLNCSSWSALTNSFQLNGYRNWFIPSKDELSLIYQRLKANNIGGLLSVPYWSSSPASYGGCGIDGGAWVQNFANGQQYGDYRSGYAGAGNLRLVRQFSGVERYRIVWSTGDTTATISVNPAVSTTYYVTISDGVHTCVDSIRINIAATNFNPLADTTRVCGASTVLDAGAGFSSYSWNTGATTRSITATTGGLYRVTAVTPFGCTVTDSTLVSIVNAQIDQSDTTICRGGTLTLTVGAFSNRNLIAHYPLDGNALDMGANFLHGTVSGAVSTTDRFGRPNRAYQFNGTSDFIRVNHDPRLNTIPLTVSCWFNASQQISPAGALVGKYYAASWTGWQLTLNEFGPTTRRLDPWYTRTNSNYVKNSSTTPNFHTSQIIDSSWHHIAFVVDSTNGKIYLDGVLQATAPWVGAPGVPSNNWPMYFGYYPSGNTAPNTYYFRGKIDDVALYSRALSAGDVQLVMNGVASTSNLQYTWSTGDTTPSISVNPTQSTTYYVTITDGITICRDSIRVNVFNSLFNPLPDTTRLCGSTTTLDAGAGYASYSWNTGANTRTITANNSALYKVVVTNAAGCSATDSTYLILGNAGIINSDTTICRGASITLTTSYAATSFTDLNGNNYPFVIIGSQKWAQRNLNVSRYRNGDVIPQVTNAGQWVNLTTGAWCWYNNDSATYASVYGRLYNWYAINDPRGLAPAGTHIPSAAEFSTLITTAGSGGALKATGTTFWNSPNTGATNSTGFTGLPGGIRTNVDGGGSFHGVGTDGWWVMASGANPDFRNLLNTNNNVNPPNLFGYYNWFSKTTGVSVRVVQDTARFLWSNGQTTPSITVNPTVSTTYYVTITIGSLVCTDSVRVNVFASNFNPLPDTIRVCGTSTVLDAGAGFTTYNWSTGATSRTITATTGGRYFVTVSSPQGCSASDTTVLSLVNARILNNDTTICKGSSVTLCLDSLAWGSTLNACTSAQLPVSLRSGLMGYWPFCGNANDISGNNYNGTVTGATLTTDRFSNANRAYSFNGIDQSIAVNSNPNLQPNRISLSAWVFIPANNSGISYFNANQLMIRSRFFGYMLIYDTVAKRVKFTLHHTPDASITSETRSLSGINDNRWHHVVGTFDGVMNRLYVDGIKIDSVTAPGSTIYYSNDGILAFGKDGNNPSSLTSHFNGKLDEIGVWNRALSHSEILTMNQSRPSIAWSTGSNSTCITVSPSQTTTYYVTLSDGITTCRDSITIGVGIVDTSLSVLGETTFCQPDSVTLIAGLATNYQWLRNNVPIAGATSRVYVASQSGIYRVALQNGFGCRDTSRAVTVIANSTPAAAFSINNSAQCFRNNLFIFTNNSTVSSGSLSYLWHFGDNNYSTQASPVYVYTAPGIYQVTLNVFGANGCSDTAVAFVEVFDQPVSRFTVNDSTQCQNGNLFQFTNLSNIASGTLSYYWNFGNNTFSTQANPAQSYAAAGTYLVTLIVTSDNGCVDSSSMLVRVYPKPNVSFVVNNLTQCLTSNSFSFTNTSNILSGSMTYLWSFGNGVTATTVNATYSYGSPNTYTVQLVGYSDFGCRDSSSVQVTVRPSPVASFTVNNNAQCLTGNSFQFTSSSYIIGGSITQYLWNFGDSTSSTLQNPPKTFANPGVYTVTLTVISNLGCTATFIRTVTVLPMPATSFVINSNPQCLVGNRFVFANTSAISSGTLSYTWTFGDGSAPVFTQNAAYTYQSAGTYTVTLSALSNSGCSRTVTQQVVVNPTPTAAFNVNSSVQCLRGNVFSFTNFSTISSGTISYRWSFGDGGTLTVANPSYTYTAAGTYTVTLIVTSGLGCSDTVSMQVIVRNMPVAAFSINSSTQCFTGNNFDFTNSSSIPVGTMTYIWDFGDGSPRVTSSNATYTYSTAGTYSVTLIAVSNFGCRDTLVRAVTVAPQPRASLTVNNPVQCRNGNSYTFTSTSTVSSGSLTYQWLIGSTISSTAASFTYSFPLAGTYVVRLIVTTDRGCVDTTSTTVSVNPSPVAQFTINNAVQCLTGNNFVFTNTSTISGGVMTYLWNFGVPPASTVTSPSFVYSSAGSYTVTLVSVSDLGCRDSVSLPVTVNPMPSGSIAQPSSTSICQGGFVTLTASGGSTYQWFLNGSAIIGATGATYNATLAGVYTVNLISIAGCTQQATNSVTLRFIEKPIVNFSFNKYCSKTPVQFTNSSVITNSGPVIYTWSVSGTPFSSVAEPLYTFALPGFYQIKLVITPTLCPILSDSLVRTIPVEAPLSNERYTSINAIANRNTQLNARVLSNATYLWLPSVGLNNAAIVNPIFNLNRQQEYRIQITTPAGCEMIDTLLVRIFKDPNLYVADVFSPNGDGKNDRLLPRLVAIQKLLYFRVYNRWGQLMFETNRDGEGWDGTFKGVKQPMETYVWIAEGVDIDGNVIKRNGSSILLR